MKYFIFIIFIIILFTNCSTNKTIISAKQTNKVVKTTDTVKTIVKKIKVAKTIENNTFPKAVTPKQVHSDHHTIFNHTAFNDLLKKFVSHEGRVNYKGFKTHIIKLQNYINALSTNQPNTKWSHQEKLAYWINAYNALTIDLILRNYPLKSIKDIKEPWEQRLWKFGARWINLNEIEHGILRKMKEPRIHFGIVCASVSCPKLQNQAFTSLNTEKLLNQATKDFLKDSERNELSENHIKISKIFKWFRKDFKQINGSVLYFINSHSELNISKEAKVSYKDYNWSLND
jgi:hypothetical protein